MLRVYLCSHAMFMPSLIIRRSYQRRPHHIADTGTRPLLHIVDPRSCCDRYRLVVIPAPDAADER
jgi:hypothetical protein